LIRLSQLTSSEVVRKCAASGDVAAWKEFIGRFHPVIAAAVLRTARPFGEPSSHLLDDLTQETYLKLCEDDCRILRSFQPRHDDAIFGFLKVIAANVVHDHFKSALAGKRGANQTDAIDDDSHIDLQAMGDGGDAVILQNLQLQEIDRILTKVTSGKDQKRKQMIFWLRHRQGLTASEIAALPAIGLTTEGVESVLLRLIVQIRSYLAEEGKK
jgi:RNA polymerase sigma-70 factor (ECF subfamily)